MPHRQNRLTRLWRHLVTDHAQLKRRVGEATLDAIEAVVKEGEARHSAEVRLAFEPSLSLAAVWRRMAPRQRALEVFGALRVWDTEANNGVLVYVLLADKAVEIIADRGAARAIPQEVWDEIARSLTRDFTRGAYRDGSVAAIGRLNQLLTQAFPADGQNNPDELPDRPALI